MTCLPSTVHSGACSSSSTRSLKCVPFCLSSFIWSVRYDNCGREVVVGVISHPSVYRHFSNWQLAASSSPSWHQNSLANCQLLFANCSIRIQQNLARLTRSQPVHALAEVGHRHAVGDYRVKVQLACFEKRVHLVPGLIHQPSVNALH